MIPLCTTKLIPPPEKPKSRKSTKTRAKCTSSKLGSKSSKASDSSGSSSSSSSSSDESDNENDRTKTYSNFNESVAPGGFTNGPGARPKKSAASSPTATTNAAVVAQAKAPAEAVPKQILHHNHSKTTNFKTIAPKSEEDFLKAVAARAGQQAAPKVLNGSFGMRNQASVPAPLGSPQPAQVVTKPTPAIPVSVICFLYNIGFSFDSFLKCKF